MSQKKRARQTSLSITSNSTDLSEGGNLRHTKEVLQDAENFRTLVENAFDAILIIVGEIPHVNIRYASKRVAEITGYSIEELFTISIEILTYPDELEKIIERYQGRLAEETVPERFETIIIRKDGKSVPIEVAVTKTIWQGESADIVHIRDISERKRAEEALHISEDKFAKVFRTSPDAITIARMRDGHYLEINEGFTAITGYTAAEVIGKTSLEVNLWVDSQDSIRLRQALMEHGEVIGLEIDFRTKDGSIHTGMMSARLIEVSGDPCIISITRDITDRKRAEEEIRERETRFRGIYEESPVGIELYDRDGTLLDANRACLEIFGISDLRAVKGFNLFADPNLTEELKAQLERGENVRYEIPFDFEKVKALNLYETTKSGTIYLDLLFTSLRDVAKEAAIGYLLHIHDITDRKRAVEALRESEARYRAVIESQVDLIGRYLPDTTLTFVNDAYCRFFGKTREELIGHSYLFMIAPEYRETVRKETEDLARVPRSLVGEYMNYRYDGKECWIQWAVQCITDKNGRVVELQAVGRDVTERKQSEEALRESEERYRSVIENIQDVFYRSDATGHLLMGSLSGAKMFGYDSADEMIGMPLDSFWPDPKERQQLLAQIKATGSVRDFEAVLRRKDGTTFNASFTTHFYHDDHGNILGTEGIIRDITERKRAEEALRKSEEKFRQITENMLDAISVLDKDGIIRYVSPSHERILGYKPEDLVGKVSLDFTHPEDVERVVASFQRIKERGGIGSQYRFRHADGHYVWGEATAKAVLDEKGDVADIVIASRDITDRKRAEEELRESEAKYRSLFENSVMGIVQTLPDGRIIGANDAFAQMYGYLSSEQMMKEVTDVGLQCYANSEARDEIRQILKEKGVMAPRELEVVRRDGSRFYVLISAREIRDDKGHTLYYQAEQLDITGRMRAEEQVRKDLQEKEVLLKEIHHRVKNNLTVISSLLNLQAKQIKTKEQALAAFDVSRDRVFAMALVHEKLYQSRDFTSIDMKSYLDNVAGQLIKMYRLSQNVRFKLDIHTAVIDINRAIPCGLILNELITNALKYAFPEGRQGEIIVSFRLYDETFYELMVSDNGIGIPANIDIEHSDSLGLHLVRMLAGQLGGSLRVSKEDGTAFSVRFPKETGRENLN